MLHDLLDESAARYPRDEALCYNGSSYSYATLQARTLALAGGLSTLGVRKWDRVVVYLPNRPEVVEVAFACSRIGAIFVPANFLLKPRQLDYLLKDAAARVLVASAAVARPLQTMEALRVLDTVVWCDTHADPAPCVTGVQTCTYDALVSSNEPFEQRRMLEDEPAALLYTSGSTGRPKGVVVSHRNLVSGAMIVSGYLHNTRSDRILAALPLSFDYGLSQVTTALTVGACAVLTTYVLPAALLQELVRERITGLAGVPTMWMHLSSLEWPGEAVQSLRYITNSGGTLPNAVIERLRRRLPNTKIYCMYGLTEAFRSTFLDPDELPQRMGSIGKAISGQEVIVVRPDGSACEPGEIGELVHRGSLVTLGYWNDPELTAQRFRPLRRMPEQVPRVDVAVWSGDLAKTDAEGYLYFVGREDHMIKSSGYRISPSDVEDVVLEVPGVLEAAAVGLPDETLGQRVTVAVVPADGLAQEIAERVGVHCRAQLPAYMVPAEIHIVDRLPRNANGKCDVTALREMLATNRDVFKARHLRETHAENH